MAEASFLRLSTLDSRPSTLPLMSRRTLKVASAIREVVSMAILTEVRDPRVRDVTVTQVEVTPDLREAKVHVSIMGDEKKQNRGLIGLQAAAGFLQAKLADRIDMRYTPKLQFKLDQGVKQSIAISEILSRVLPKDDRPPAAGEGEKAADEEVEPGFEETKIDDADDDAHNPGG